MINIHSDVLNGGLNAAEFYTFCHLLKRINMESTCFPSKPLLKKETKLGKLALSKALKSLVDKKIISREQVKNDKGQYNKILYTILVEGCGVFIGAKGKKVEIMEEKDSTKPETKNRSTKNGSTGNGSTGSSPLSIVQLEVLEKLSIEQIEVFLKEKKLSISNPSKNAKTPQTTPKTKTSKEKEKISAKKEKEAKEIIDKANPVVEDDGLKVLQASAKLKQTILSYLQQNPSILTLIKDKAKWRGGMESELEGWCDHHCDSHKAKTKPHSHFSKTFPSWLMRAKQFSRSKGSTKPNNPKPSFDYSGGRDLHNATF